ncbi:hypothetical protein AF72_06855 [Xylella taiwanensis]|uniref:Uncharacterized protein n=2 Tax=Xylella taiwanensis TaxID=1444770 RepID=Z9JKD7_9GAMM|nr:hypothetical protein AB672_07330 [Xylella taiwanensis]EWS78217.1 hypothetical protein AF72_06855 [Xylella taiwanensis]
MCSDGRAMILAPRNGLSHVDHVAIAAKPATIVTATAWLQEQWNRMRRRWMIRYDGGIIF